MAVKRLLTGRSPWRQVLETVAGYQYASAAMSTQTMATWIGDGVPTVNPAAFAGVSSAGYSIAEPIIATIDRIEPAPPLDLPPAWWDDASQFMRQVEQLIESEVQDAGRSAAQAEMVALGHQNYVRMLVPPSCKRCVVLAGRVYRNLDGFARHSRCDCVHVPIQDWQDAYDRGMVTSPREAFERGYIRDLTAGERQAIEDGADITQIINSTSGIDTADLDGRRVKITRYGTTKRSEWRRRNPSVRVRLRPESIYRIVREDYDGDPEQAKRLLRLYGYIT